MTMTAQKRTVTDAEVKRVHASALLIDTHNDFPTEQAGKDRPFTGAVIDIGASSPMAHTDLARLKSGGVGAVFFAAYVGANFGLGPRGHAVHADDFRRLAVAPVEHARFNVHRDIVNFHIACFRVLYTNICSQYY